MHKWSVDGVGGFIEEFIPTLAIETHQTVVSVPVALYYGDRYFGLASLTPDVLN